MFTTLDYIDTCHTDNETINFLKIFFGEHILSRRGPVVFPPRSCNLIPLDNFLCSNVKSLVYSDAMLKYRQLMQQFAK